MARRHYQNRIVIDQAEVERRLLAGETDREIAAAVGIGRPLLSLRLKQWGLRKQYPRRSGRRPGTNLGPYASHLNLRRVELEAMQVGGASIEEMAASAGCSRTAVVQAFRRWGNGQPLWGTALATRVRMARAAGMALVVGMGLTYEEIAEAMGLTRERVRQVLKVAVEEARQRGGGGA